MNVFLTGVTGLLGNNLARLLTDRGDQVTALVRTHPPTAVLEGIDARLVYGDLDDQATINDAIAGCDAVIHAAALLHIGWQRRAESLRVNRDGTAHVATAARRHGKPMVHIGTVNTLAMPPQNALGSTAGGSLLLVDERTPITAETRQVPCSYTISKLASVQVIEQQVAAGLDARIVHPAFMLGPWDWKPSSGRMIAQLAKHRWVPSAPVGGCSVCDARDVAAGALAALERGISGRHYILAGENWTYRRLWSEIAKRLGRLPPLLPVGPLARAGIAALSGLKRGFTQQESDINTASLKISSQILWFDSSRAKQELDYSNRDVHQTIDDAVRWIVDNKL